MNRRGGRARTPLAIAILFLLALIPFALYRGSQVPEAEAAWWNPSWQYRQSIAVTNNTTEQTNVYISVSLDTSNTTKFQADCGDLRFTKQNGQLLPYYIVSGCGTASTSVHVQLDTFPAGEQTFYAYYGNPSADNGFSSNDFLTEATNYTVDGTGSEETGPGPVAHWKLDEGSGSTTKDSINQLTGTIYSQTASWATEDQCVSGKCIYFNGVESAWNTVRVPDDSKLDQNLDGVTVSLWVIITAQKNHQLLYKRNSGGTPGWRSYELGINANNAPYFRIDNSSGTSVTATSDSGIELDTWYQLTGVYNGSNIQIYIDSSASVANPPSQTGDILDTNSSLLIGGLDGTYITKGYIDEVKIFPYDLNEDQIKAEYNLGAAAVMGTGPTVAPPAGGTLSDSLVAHWALDEQYGQAAHDMVGNSHGTFGASTSPGSDDPTWKPAGECKVNGCASFDGGDYIPISNNIALTTEATWSFWYNSNNFPSTTNMIFDKYNTTGTERSYRISEGSNNAASIQHSSDGINNQTSSSSSSFLIDGGWHHALITFDNGTFKFYRDGVYHSEATGYSSLHSPPISTEIGRQRAGNTAYFNGLIDEVKIYNTALTADQVKQDMNAGASVAYSVGSEEADELEGGAGAPSIAEWKFDEKQGTVAYDSSGNANDGTVNGATWKSGCQQGACLVFDGVDDYLSCGTSSVLTSMAAFTIEGWVKTTATTFNPVVSLSSGYSGFHVPWSSGRSLIYLGPSNFRYFSNSPTDILDGEWHHVAAVVTGSGQTDINNAKMYVDGKEQDVYSTNTSGPPETKTLCRIGRAGGFYNLGQIDHLRIYDYARTPAQIAYDYNRGAPVAHWKFDECEGTVAHDASGNENHGTINIGASGTQTTAGTCSTSGAWANGASGKFNSSLSFDRTDDHILVATNAQLDLVNSPITLSAWVKWKGGGNQNYVIDKNSNKYSLTLNANGNHSPRFYTPSTGSLDAPNPISANVWHMLSATHDGSTAKLYVDGVLVNQMAGSSNRTAGGDLAIGCYATCSSTYSFDGQIDDVRIYNYALSSAQIMKVFNQGLGVRYGPTTGGQ